jgi:UDP-sugar transporter A1/2/3
MSAKFPYLKYISLIVLTIQTTTLVMILRYSRINYDINEGNYISSTAIVCSEFIKLIVCLVILTYDSGIY